MSLHQLNEGDLEVCDAEAELAVANLINASHWEIKYCKISRRLFLNILFIM
jgi:hypothetical protein